MHNLKGKNSGELGLSKAHLNTFAIDSSARNEIFLRILLLLDPCNPLSSLQGNFLPSAMFLPFVTLLRCLLLQELFQGNWINPGQ